MTTIFPELWKIRENMDLIGDIFMAHCPTKMPVFVCLLFGFCCRLASSGIFHQRTNLVMFLICAATLKSELCLPAPWYSFKDGLWSKAIYVEWIWKAMLLKYPRQAPKHYTYQNQNQFLNAEKQWRKIFQQPKPEQQLYPESLKHGKWWNIEILKPFMWNGIWNTPKCLEILQWTRTLWLYVQISQSVNSDLQLPLYGWLPLTKIQKTKLLWYWQSQIMVCDPYLHFTC